MRPVRQTRWITANSDPLVSEHPQAHDRGSHIRRMWAPEKNTSGIVILLVPSRPIPRLRGPQGARLAETTRRRRTGLTGGPRLAWAPLARPGPDSQVAHHPPREAAQRRHLPHVRPPCRWIPCRPQAHARRQRRHPGPHGAPPGGRAAEPCRTRFLGEGVPPLHLKQPLAGFSSAPWFPKCRRLATSHGPGTCCRLRHPSRNRRGHGSCSPPHGNHPHTDGVSPATSL